MDEYTVTEVELFRPHPALEHNYLRSSPFTAAQNKRADLWYCGDGKFCFRPLPRHSRKRQYPKINYITGRPENDTYAPRKPIKPLSWWIDEGLLVEVKHNRAFLYIWSKTFEELDELLGLKDQEESAA